MAGSAAGANLKGSLKSNAIDKIVGESVAELATSIGEIQKRSAQAGCAAKEAVRVAAGGPSRRRRSKADDCGNQRSDDSESGSRTYRTRPIDPSINAGREVKVLATEMRACAPRLQSVLRRLRRYLIGEKGGRGKKRLHFTRHASRANQRG